ncbi:hypothetical protein FB451DRAFT_1521513 [Mycena latifolia]|nr:hypothetical protein FB451DRAFT_1521513 [Mycena latifolia]
MVAPEITYILGGWNFGICADVLLQGILFAQFAHYMGLSRGDPLALKLFVAGLALLTTARSIQALAVMWVQNVIHFENVAVASTMWYNYWLDQISLTLEAIVGFYVQIFLCHRLWAISRNIYVVVVTMGIFTFALASAGIWAFFMFGTDKAAVFDWVAIHLATTFAGDLLLTGSITFFLIQHSKEVLPRGETATILRSLLRLTIQSAAPAALCAFINLVSSQLAHRGAEANGPLMVSIITNMALPKLYAVSAMWTLNSREGLRGAVSGRATYTLGLGTAPDHEAGQPDGEGTDAYRAGDGEKFAPRSEGEIQQPDIPKVGNLPL